MKNVLIISQYFPPVNHIAARRFGYMVGYMEEFGWKPWVVTQPGIGDLSVSIPEEQIVRIPTASDQVRSKPTGPRLWRGIHYRIQVFATSWYWSVRSSRQLIDSFPTPDIIIASYGPTSALWIGRYFANRYRAPWIADFRDLGALRKASGTRLGKEIDSYTERAALDSASAMTTVGTTLYEMLRSAYDKPAQKVYNGYMFTGDQICVNKTEPPATATPDYIYYAGTVYMHQLPALRIVFDVLAGLPDVKLRMRLLGVPRAVKQITDRAREPQFHDRVDLREPTSAASALTEANSAFCNLVLGDLSVRPDRTQGHVTGKFRN